MFVSFVQLAEKKDFICGRFEFDITVRKDGSRGAMEVDEMAVLKVW